MLNGTWVVKTVIKGPNAVSSEESAAVLAAEVVDDDGIFVGDDFGILPDFCRISAIRSFSWSTLSAHAGDPTKSCTKSIAFRAPACSCAFELKRQFTSSLPANFVKAQQALSFFSWQAGRPAAP